MSELTAEEIEAKCVHLRQVASVMADFYGALVAERFPADKAGDAALLWLAYELGWDVDE